MDRGEAGEGGVSRFDIDDDGEQQISWEMWQWNLSRALASTKGQARLREFRDALLAVPGHRLVRSSIATPDGDVCAIGAFAAHKRTQRGSTWAEATADLNQTYHPVQSRTKRDGSQYEFVEEADAWQTQDVGVRECGLNRTLAWHLGYQNDESFYGARTPEQLWQATYDWVCKQLGEPA